MKAAFHCVMTSHSSSHTATSPAASAPSSSSSFLWLSEYGSQRRDRYQGTPHFHYPLSISDLHKAMCLHCRNPDSKGTLFNILTDCLRQSYLLIIPPAGGPIGPPLIPPPIGPPAGPPRIPPRPIPIPGPRPPRLFPNVPNLYVNATTT